MANFIIRIDIKQLDSYMLQHLALSNPPNVQPPVDRWKCGLSLVMLLTKPRICGPCSLCLTMAPYNPHERSKLDATRRMIAQILLDAYIGVLVLTFAVVAVQIGSSLFSVVSLSSARSVG